MKSKDIKKIESLSEKNKSDEIKIYEFYDLLDLAKDKIDSKKIHLWKVIYQNALDDRVNAHHLYTQALMTLGTASVDHMNLGGILVKYLERMSKSNDQILELSKIVSDELTAINEPEESKMSEKDIFNEIEKR